MSASGASPSQPEPQARLSGAALELIKRIRGFEELESLLFLFRRRGQEWIPERLALELHFKESSVHDALVRLASMGFLERTEGSFVYPVASRPTDHAVTTLSETYQADRLEVIKTLTDLSLERMRSSTIQTFAESFRFKRRPNA